MWRPLEMLITVKAYPNPSASLAEANCIAGITRDGRFARLYPVPFRDLEDEKRFRKYQWIKVSVSRPKSDPRPESFRPNIGTLQVMSGVLPTKAGWRTRKEVVLPLRSPSLCDLQDREKRDGTSLGLFRPKKILDFDWTPTEHDDWTPGEIAKLSQQDLFLTRDRNLLEKVPFDFRYRFRCENCRSKEPHHAKIIDWELAQQFRKLRWESETIEDCLRKLRDHWLGMICASDKDAHFFTGNMSAHPHSFLILGVFWPPKEKTLPLFTEDRPS